ncbi:hypothetical protein ABK040_001256 [Willaertia magna]
MDQNEKPSSLPKVVTNPFIPPYASQFSIVNELPQLTSKDLPIFKAKNNESKDLYSYNLLQCPHHKEEVMGWLNSSDDILIDGVYTLISGNPRNDKDIILNYAGASMQQMDLTQGQYSNLLTGILHHQQNKENQPINSTPISYEQFKTTQKISATSNTPTKIKSRKKKKQNKEQKENKPTTIVENKSTVTIKANLAPKLLDNENLTGAIDECFAWSDFRDNEEELISDKLLSQISSEISLGYKNNYLKDVPLESLIKLLNVLESQIKIGDQIIKNLEDATKEDVVEKVNEDKKPFEIGLKCTVLALKIMSGKSVSKEILVEECFESALELTKVILRKYIFTIIESEDTSTSSRKKQKKKFSCNKEIIQISSIFKSFYKILKRLKLKDEFVLSLSDIAVSVFFVNGIDELQLSALDVITKIFSTYQEHREQILAEITASLLRLPANKKSDKSYRVQEEGNLYIQMFTSLMLQLVHSCTAVPIVDTVSRRLTFDDIEEQDGKEEDNDEIMKESSFSEDKMVHLYEQASSCACVFVEYFLDRCINAEIVDGDNRLIIEHFVDDLLSVVHLPTFPAADLLLQSLTSVLCTKYLIKEVADKYRVLTLKILGKIASRIKELESTNKELMQTFISTEENSDNENDEEEKNFTSNDVMSPSKKKLKKKKANTDSPTKRLQEEFKNLFELNEIEKNKLLLYAYLSTKSKEDHSVFFSRQFAVCQWFYDEKDVEKKLPFYISLFTRNLREVDNSSTSTTLARDSYIFVMTNRKQGLVNKFDFILIQIISVLKDERAKVRADAIKALQNIITMDPSVLNKNFVQLGIRERSIDQSPSVRESVVDLIGNTMITLKKFDDFYIKTILERVKDVGKSVRKKSISLLGEICTLITDDNMITEICKTLANRLIRTNKEEDTVTALVLKTFKKLWFDKNTSEKLKVSGLQMVDVVGKQFVDFKQYKDHWLYQIISMALKSKDDRFKPSMMIIIETLLQHIMKLDEEKVESDIPNRDNITTCMSTLHLICLADPELLLPHFKSIRIYVDRNYVTGNNPKPSLIYHAASILEKLCPLINKPDTKFNDSLFNELRYLMSGATGMKLETLEACVSCLCAFSARVKYVGKLYEILKLLSPFVIYNTDNAQNEARTARVVYIIGLMCRYFDFDTAEIDSQIIDPKLKPGNILTTLYHNTLSWLKCDSLFIKQKASRALGFLLIRQPKLFIQMNSQNIVSQSLKNENKEFVYNVLLMFKDFLIAEESKMSAASGTENLDTGVTTSFMSSYIDALLNLLHDPSDAVRFASLEVVDLIIQQGLTIPARVMRHSIALESDPNSQISERAHTLNIYLNDRFHQMFLAEAKHGFVQCFYHLKGISTRTNETIRGCFDSNSVLSNCYEIIGSFTLDQKKNTFCDVVKSMFNLVHDKVDKITHDLLSKIRFLIEVLTYLKYKSLYEPASIVARLGEKLDEIGDGIRTELKTNIKSQNVKEIKTSLVVACSIAFLIQFKNTMQMRYNLTNSKMEEYLADHKAFQKKILPPLRDVISYDFDTIIPNCQHILSLTSFGDEAHKKIDEIYKWLKEIIKKHMHDGFNIPMQTTTTKRGRKTSGGGTTKKKTTKKTKTKKKAPKRKKSEKLWDYEEEEETDEEQVELELQDDEEMSPVEEEEEKEENNGESNEEAEKVEETVIKKRRKKKNNI